MSVPSFWLETTSTYRQASNKVINHAAVLTGRNYRCSEKRFLDLGCWVVRMEFALHPSTAWIHQRDPRFAIDSNPISGPTT